MSKSVTMKVIKSVILTIIVCCVHTANSEEVEEVNKVEEDAIVNSDISDDIIESRALPGKSCEYAH
jgi:hypothetical protein